MNMQFSSVTEVRGSKGPPSTISVLPDAKAGSGCTSHGMLCYLP